MLSKAAYVRNSRLFVLPDTVSRGQEPNSYFSYQAGHMLHCQLHMMHKENVKVCEARATKTYFGVNACCHSLS